MTRIRVLGAVDAGLAGSQGRVAATAHVRKMATVDGRDPAAQPVPDDAPTDLGDARGGKPEVLEDRAGRGVAPKWSSPMIAPSSPTQRSQPSDTPTSTLTRFFTDGGRTSSR